MTKEMKELLKAGIAMTLGSFGIGYGAGYLYSAGQANQEEFTYKKIEEMYNCPDHSGLVKEESDDGDTVFYRYREESKGTEGFTGIGFRGVKKLLGKK